MKWQQAAKYWPVPVAICFAGAAYFWFFAVVGLLFFKAPLNAALINVLVFTAAGWAIARIGMRTTGQKPSLALCIAALIVVGLVAGIRSTLLISELSPRWLIGVAFGIAAMVVPWIGLWSQLRELNRVRDAVGLVLIAALLGTGILLPIQGLDGSGLMQITPYWNLPSTSSQQMVVADDGNAKSVAGVPKSQIASLSFRGPKRDGKVPVPEGWKPQFEQWKSVWTRPIGKGWGGCAIDQDHVYTIADSSSESELIALRIADGETLWRVPLGEAYSNTVSGDGARSTPAIEGGIVYAVSAVGDLVAVDRQSGKPIWNRNVVSDSSATLLPHGVCDSPLLIDDELWIFGSTEPDYAILVFDRFTGVLKHHFGTQSHSYVSLQQMKSAGQDWILAQGADAIFAYDRNTRAQLWTYPFTNSDRTLCSQPVILNSSPEKIVLTAGYGAGAECIEPAQGENGKWSVRRVWKDRTLQTKFCSAIEISGLLYGLDNGILQCVDPETGKAVWKKGRYGHGQVIEAGGNLIIQCENGDLAVVRADKEQWREQFREPALSSKSWNYPTVAFPWIVLRNDEVISAWRIE